jgi:hypothetical protein
MNHMYMKHIHSDCQLFPGKLNPRTLCMLAGGFSPHWTFWYAISGLDAQPQDAITAPTVQPKPLDDSCQIANHEIQI